MSDPFSDIDKDVTLDKFKSLLYKYKKLIIILLAFILVFSVAFYYLNYKKKAKDIRLSGYLIEIMSIVNTENEFKKSINLLISRGGYWSLLGHELRGHFYLKQGNLIEAGKDFNKIINEQLSTQPLRARAQEMLNNINLNDEGNS